MSSSQCPVCDAQLALVDEHTDTLVSLLLQWQWPDGGWNGDKDPAAHISSFPSSFGERGSNSANGQPPRKLRSCAVRSSLWTVVNATRLPEGSRPIALAGRTPECEAALSLAPLPALPHRVRALFPPASGSEPPVVQRSSPPLLRACSRDGAPAGERAQHPGGGGRSSSHKACR